MIYEWISELRPDDRILDIGAGAGSFPAAWAPCFIAALDEDQAAFLAAAQPASPKLCRVFASSDRLPFADRSFDLVVCHHVLEHVVEIHGAMREIRRVLKRAGRFYAAIPDGHGFSDTLYRYVFAGGGHVNRFSKLSLVRLAEQCLGLQLAGWQRLFSSFVYLSRLSELLTRPPPGLAPRTLRFRRLPSRLIHFSQWFLYLATRLIDRCCGTELALYGWALCFEPNPSAAPVEEPGYINVCVRCGAGHPAAAVERMSWWRYRCPNCQSPTPYTRPLPNTE